MKILFFLVVTANVSLFMWEYKTGAWKLPGKMVASNTAIGQEQIRLVRELTKGVSPFQRSKKSTFILQKTIADTLENKAVKPYKIVVFGNETIYSRLMEIDSPVKLPDKESYPVTKLNKESDVIIQK